MTSIEKKRIYADLCDQGKITGLFMQPWWLEATGSYEVALGVRNGKVVGAMPFVCRRAWGMRKIGMPEMTHHLKLWMDKPADISDHKWLTREKQIIWLILDDLPSYSFFSMIFEERSFNNWLPFYWRGFSQELRYSFVIDRHQYESGDHKVSASVRRDIRDGGQELIIRPNVDLVAFYEVCCDTFKRQGMRMPYTFARFIALDAAIQAHHAGVRLGVYSGANELMAVTYLLWDDECAYYFLAGDNALGRQHGAGILLCQEVIRMAFEEHQVRMFDFCGSMLESIADVGSQFGAQPSGLMKIWRAKHKWLDMALALTR